MSGMQIVSAITLPSMQQICFFEVNLMSFGPGYACVSCKTYLRPRKNDITVLQNNTKGQPYKLWLADLWECPDCGNQVILGYGQNAFSEYYEEDFKRLLQSVTHTIEGPIKALNIDEANQAD